MTSSQKILVNFLCAIKILLENERSKNEKKHTVGHNPCDQADGYLWVWTRRQKIKNGHHCFKIDYFDGNNLKKLII
jgi:hypothetical protein